MTPPPPCPRKNIGTKTGQVLSEIWLQRREPVIRAVQILTRILQYIDPHPETKEPLESAVLLGQP